MAMARARHHLGRRQIRQLQLYCSFLTSDRCEAGSDFVGHDTPHFAVVILYCGAKLRVLHVGVPSRQPSTAGPAVLGGGPELTYGFVCPLRGLRLQLGTVPDLQRPR